MSQVPASRWGSLRPGLSAVLVAAAIAGAAQPARAQSLNCQTIEADVQAEQPTALPMGAGQGDYSAEGRTSEQIIQRWATAQDASPEACRVLREVERRLAAEDAFARQQCPNVLPGVRTQADLAQGESKILCRGRN